MSAPPLEPSAALPAPILAAAATAAPPRARRSRLRLRGPGWPGILAWIALSITLAPLVLVGVGLLISPESAASDTWGQLDRATLRHYIVQTAGLALGVAIVTSVIGVGTAWLVSMTEFPGRHWLQHALLLPLACPLYLVAYALADLSDAGGPLAHLLGSWGVTQPGRWLPSLRTMPGAILIFGAALYPYVHVLARASFEAQSVCALEAARVLGRGPWASFWAVGLPLARPAAAAGIGLVVMETLADIGAVQHLAIDTLAVGIQRTWYAMGDLAGAQQMALGLAGLAGLLLLLERGQRGAARVWHTTQRWQRLPRPRLHGAAAFGAFLACALPPLLGFVLPLLAFVNLGFQADWQTPDLTQTALTGIVLAAIAAVTITLIAALIGFAGRLEPSRWRAIAIRVAGLGYALPGLVVAVALLAPLTMLRDATGWLLTGTFAGLGIAYLVRFFGPAMGGVEAALSKLPPDLERAGAALGRSRWTIVTRLLLPLSAGGLGAAMLTVFVEVLKELPASLLLRPFGVETLATRVYRLAADERLAQSAVPALLLIGLGTLPVLLLARAAERSRRRVSGVGD